MKFTVGDLNTRLSHGALSNLSVSAEGSGQIADAKVRDKIVDYVNDGLTRLHSKFILNEAQLIIELLEGRTDYPLESRYGLAAHVVDEVGSGGPGDLVDVPIFIIDDLQPFKDDLIKVLAVFDYGGNRVPLNDVEDPLSVFTPRTHLLQVPDSGVVQVLSLMYQARHVEIPYGDSDAVITLPDCLQTALTSFVASEFYSHMNGQENSAKGQEHYLKYEMLCQQAVDNDLVSSAVSSTNTNFEKRGWI